MLTEKDLEKQETFFTDGDGKKEWVDFPNCDYQVSYYKGKLALFLFCEVDGATDLICECIESIEHLKLMYEELSNESFI